MKEIMHALISAAFYTDSRFSENTVIVTLVWHTGPTLYFLCFIGLFCLAPCNSDTFGKCLSHSEYSVSLYFLKFIYNLWWFQFERLSLILYIS